jgi:uncharacterized small protein (DUF1192 family)
MTLFGDFLDNTQRRTHKWYHYFPAYERHFERFRNRYVTLVEIGVDQGGSLQLWKRYLGPLARIVGVDINPLCKQVEEDQIHVRIGSQDDREFLMDLVAEFGNPDIVIDDGSHQQPHVNATFDILYPEVAKNGAYLVEDLHAAYWPNHGGGLHHPASFIERAKVCIDEMHAEYSGGELPHSALGDRTASIHFYDSLVLLEVGEYRVKGQRATGHADFFHRDWKPGGTCDGDQMNKSSEPTHAPTAQAAVELARLQQIAELQRRVGALEAEIATLRASTSWRITEPLRTVVRLVKK